MFSKNTYGDDVKEDMHDIMDAMKRLEDKLDKILIGSR